MSKLLLSKELQARCIGIARAGLPHEACGLIGGTRPLEDDSETTWQAESIHPVRNVKMSPTTFALDGQGMIEAENRIDDAGEEVIGVWHSHPSSPAVPSTIDIEDASIYDPFATFVHVIVSLQGFAPTVAAFSYEQREDYPLRKYWLVRLGS